MNKITTCKTKLGKHMVCDMWGVTSPPGDGKALVEELKLAAKKAGATTLESVHHNFQPSGVTALLLLSESHISIHSWPEHNYVAVDVFTCGENVHPELAIDYLVSLLKPSKANVRLIERGEINV